MGEIPGGILGYSRIGTAWQWYAGGRLAPGAPGGRLVEDALRSGAPRRTERSRPVAATVYDELAGFVWGVTVEGINEAHHGMPDS